ncbi:MAG: hypothetical protein HON90_02030 [Halobacteriovoraceae bacterium]|jgi:hypothetical protein|nr:hypothetical protein [Halobacteriovoraceae bacterium]
MNFSKSLLIAALFISFSVNVLANNDLIPEKVDTVHSHDKVKGKEESREICNRDLDVNNFTRRYACYGKNALSIPHRLRVNGYACIGIKYDSSAYNAKFENAVVFGRLREGVFVGFNTYSSFKFGTTNFTSALNEFMFWDQNKNMKDSCSSKDYIVGQCAKQDVDLHESEFKVTGTNIGKKYSRYPIGYHGTLGINIETKSSAGKDYDLDMECAKF